MQVEDQIGMPEKSLNKVSATEIVTNVPIPSILIDNGWKVVALNGAASEAFKVTVAEAPGMRLKDVLGDALGKPGDHVLEVIKEGHIPVAKSMVFTDDTGLSRTFSPSPLSRSPGRTGDRRAGCCS